MDAQTLFLAAVVALFGGFAATLAGAVIYVRLGEKKS